MRRQEERDEQTLVIVTAMGALVVVPLAAGILLAGIADVAGLGGDGSAVVFWLTVVVTGIFTGGWFVTVERRRPRAHGPG